MRTAAAYVRMSTDHQRYSIENQLAQIQSYCHLNDLDLCRLYTDAGVSGLTFENRPGLRSLVGDVEAGPVPFTVLIVLDVSRWGRFQNPDEGAYYEHVLRRAGVRMIYCGEPFENDDSPTATIVKSVKRAMAAEYSRELSKKVCVGLRRTALNGFRCGGLPGYGLRRVILGRDGSESQVAEKGQWKAIQDDRTVLRLGPSAEVRAVRRIFKLYIVERMDVTAIAAAMVQERRPSPGPVGWSRGRVGRILRNEKYAGTLLYGHSTEHLQSKRRRTDPSSWIRVPNAHPAIVSPKTFAAAQAIRQRGVRIWSADEILLGLRSLYSKHGTITRVLVESSTELPSTNSIRDRFGSIAQACANAGVPLQSVGVKRRIMAEARIAQPGPERCSLSRASGPGSSFDWDTILAEAVSEGWTASEVAFRSKCSPTSVLIQSKARGVTLAGRPPSMKTIRWAHQLALAAKLGESPSQLACRLRVHPSSVDWAMARNKMKLRADDPVLCRSKNWSEEFRRAGEAGETRRDLARRLGVPTKTVSASARRLGVKLA